MSENLEQWLREEPLRSDPRPWIAALIECLQRMDVEVGGDRFYVGDGELKRLVEKYRDQLLPSEEQLREDLALLRPGGEETTPSGYSLEQLRAMAREKLGFTSDQRLTPAESGQLGRLVRDLRAEQP